MKLKNKHSFIILIIIIFHGINNYIWLRLNLKPVYDDQAFHLLGGLQIIEMLKLPFWGIFTKIMSFSVVAFYPPLFHFCMAIFNIIFGKSLISSVMTNMVFLAVLSFSLYYIGKKLGDKNIGVLSTFIVSMYPFVFGLSRTPLLDFALTAMVALSLCCLIYTDNFTNRLSSLLFGFSLGLGMLTKQLFIFFIIVPLSFVIIGQLFKKEMNKSKAKNLFISFLAAFFLDAYWYVVNLKKVLPNYIRAGYHDADMFGPSNLFSLDSMVYYFYQLIVNQMLPFFCIVFAVGAFIFFRSKMKMKSFLLFSILGAYIIFTFLIKIKEPKTTVPYLSVFAIVSAAGILNLRPVKLKKFFIAFLVVFGLYQYFIVSYVPLLSPRSRGVRPSFFMPAHMLDEVIGYQHFPVRKNWKLDEVLLLIQKQEQNGNRIVGVSWQDAAQMRRIGIRWKENYIITNGSGIDYYCRLKGLTSVIVNLDNKSSVEPWWENDNSLPDTLILTDKLEKQVPENIVQKYKLIEILAMPDESNVYTYITQ